VKRISFGLLLAGVCFLLRAEDANALKIGMDDYRTGVVFDQTSCEAQDVVTYPEKTFEIIAIKTNPPNPIAIGQDEAKRGVDIAVTISSLPGTAYYFNWVRKEVDGGYYSYVPKGYNCNRPDSGLYWCYRVEYDCVKSGPETIYRMLRPENTQIWIEPSIETKAWLSWGENPFGDPLRFVFPDDWGMGVWTPEGWKMSQYAGIGSEWWTFLYGDPTAIVVPTSSMVRVNAPDLFYGNSAEHQGMGLFGAFTNFPGDFAAAVETGNMDQCLIDSAHVTIEGGKDQFADIRGCKINPSGASSDGQIRLFQIFFTSIPLDLPGKWNIGVTAFQQPAKYAKGTRTEKDVPIELMQAGPTSANYSGKNSYEIGDFTFASYIIIATPCYNGDPESCKN
jgi:hypothetical protein